MPSAGDKTKPQLISQKVDASYHVVITCDVEVDLSDPELDVKFPLAKVPLAGDWKLRLYREDGNAKILLKYGKSEYGRFGSAVVVGLAISSLQGGVEQEVESVAGNRDTIPALSKKGSPYSGSTHTSILADWPSFALNGRQEYRLRFAFDQETPGLTVPTKGPASLAKRMADLHLKQLPSQLRLFFPTVGKDSAELWVSSELLAKSAPYFRDLLSSDFFEATPRRSKRTRKIGAQALPAPLAADKDFDDSDDETDAFLLEHKPLKLGESTEASELSFREITITQTSFSTYHALLVYFETGYVRFAPLRSASSPSNPSASSARGDFLTKQFEDDPSLPLPISPKSMFRLADLLRLPEEDPLSSLYFRAFSGSLTHHGAAFELFSETSICFDKIRKIALDYVVKNWDAVSGTASWKEMMEKVKRDEVQGSSTVLVELMQAREEAARKKE